MIRRAFWIASCAIALVFACAIAGCGDDGASSSAPWDAAPAPANKPKRVKSPGDQGAKDEKKITLPRLGETAFIKSAKSRDPFMPRIELLKKEEVVEERVQRNVKLDQYDISDLKLIGIITNIGDPRAMVTTPDGMGHVLRRGDYVGRADNVSQMSQGSGIQVNWRVARIHGSGKQQERGVYFVRDDPTTTKGVDATLFMPLYENR